VKPEIQKLLDFLQAAANLGIGREAATDLLNPSASPESISEFGEL